MQLKIVANADGNFLHVFDRVHVGHGITEHGANAERGQRVDLTADSQPETVAFLVERPAAADTVDIDRVGNVGVIIAVADGRKNLHNSQIEHVADQIDAVRLKLQLGGKLVAFDKVVPYRIVLVFRLLVKTFDRKETQQLDPGNNSQGIKIVSVKIFAFASEVKRRIIIVRPDVGRNKSRAGICGKQIFFISVNPFKS